MRSPGFPFDDEFLSGRNASALDNYNNRNPPTSTVRKRNIFDVIDINDDDDEDDEIITRLDRPDYQEILGDNMAKSLHAAQLLLDRH